MQSYAGSERQVNDAAAADPEQPRPTGSTRQGPSCRTRSSTPLFTPPRCPEPRPGAPEPPRVVGPLHLLRLLLRRLCGCAGLLSWAVSSATNAHDVARTGAAGLGLEPACRRRGRACHHCGASASLGISPGHLCIAFGGSSYPHGRQPTGRQPRVSHRIGDRRVAEKVLDQSRIGAFIGERVSGLSCDYCSRTGYFMSTCRQSSKKEPHHTPELAGQSIRSA